MSKKKQNPRIQNGVRVVPQKCPSCGSKEFVLCGAVQQRIEQRFNNGKLVGARIRHEKEQELVWNRISCVDCNSQWESTDDRMLRLQEELEKAQFELAFMTGRLVSENRLPC
jgi:hypothetical protein